MTDERISQLRELATELFDSMKQKGLTWKEAKTVAAMTNELVQSIQAVCDMREKMESLPLE